MTLIDDGQGTGSKARVDSDNRLHVSSVGDTEELHANDLGNAYNINTELIAFTAAGTLMYIKNNEQRDLAILAMAVGMGNASTSDLGEVKIRKNCTGGDLISDATAIAINENRNYGSSQTLDADVFAGKSGGTSTGGSTGSFFLQSAGTRLFAALNFILPRGSSLAIIVDPKLSSGSINIYATVLCYLKNPNSQD